MKIEEQLLVFLSYVNLSLDEVSMVQSLFHKVKFWEDFIRLGKHNRCLPLVGHNLKVIGLFDQVPPTIKEVIEQECQKIQDENEKRWKSAEIFLRRFNEKGVEVVILKGNVFGPVFFKNPNYKKMNDMDILIKKKDVREVIQIYSELGYFSLGEILGKKIDDYDSFSHHLPPFFDKGLTCMIGTHWGLVNPMVGYKLDYDKMWERIQTYQCNEMELKCLSPEDNLVHLCVHLSLFKSGIKEVGDIYNLLRFYRGSLDWEYFVDQTQKSRIVNAVYLALSLSNAFCPMIEVQHVLGTLVDDVSDSIKKLVEKKTASLTGMLEQRTAHMSKIDKAYSKFKSTKKLGEKWSYYIEIWENLLLPPEIELERITMEKKKKWSDGIKQRILAPIAIFKSFQHDLGTKVFFLLMLHTAYSMAKTTVTYPFKKEVEGLEFYANKLGVDLEALKALQERLE